MLDSYLQIICGSVLKNQNVTAEREKKLKQYHIKCEIVQALQFGSWPAPDAFGF